MWSHGLWKNLWKWGIYLPWNPTLKNTAKKLLGILIDEHLNINEQITNVCKGVSRKRDASSWVSSLLLCQTLSSVDNSTIVFFFGCLNLFRSYRKINKLHERSLRSCHNDCTSSYDELLTVYVCLTILWVWHLKG